MLYTGNPYIIKPGNVFFMHMILMDSVNELAMNLGETYLVTENGNERLRQAKIGFSGVIGVCLCVCRVFPIKSYNKIPVACCLLLCGGS